jgi:hypothetical protein
LRILCNIVSERKSVGVAADEVVSLFGVAGRRRGPEEPVRETGIYFQVETLRRPGINADIRPEESVSSMVDVVKRMRTSAER